MKTLTIEQRFLNKLTYDVNKTCWNWTGSKNWFGYGLFLVANKMKYAHRISYELFNGIIPEGLVIDHTCGNTSCVHPRHLEAVTRKENTLRGNGFANHNRQKQFCPKGHELKGDNLSKSNLRRGKRLCLICNRMRDRLAQLKKRRLNE